MIQDRRTGSQQVPEDLDSLVGQNVVLDTEGETLYIGRLVACTPEGFWLAEADVHNCREGHAPREQYVAESARDGVRVNRARVFVFRHIVLSVSALADALTD